MLHKYRFSCRRTGFEFFALEAVISGVEFNGLWVNTIGPLSIDAVRDAKAPGRPMALTPLVNSIENRVLSSVPRNPIRPTRDGSVVSNERPHAADWLLVYRWLVTSNCLEQACGRTGYFRAARCLSERGFAPSPEYRSSERLRAMTTMRGFLHAARRRRM
jgi:hypothetical protein